MADKPYSKILERLPVKSLLRFKCVCKRWRDEINTTFFITSHTRQVRINEPNSSTLIFRCLDYSSNEKRWWSRDIFSLDLQSSSLEVKKLPHYYPSSYESSYYSSFNYAFVGSSNGLVCFREKEYEPQYSIYNPATGIGYTLPKLYPNHQYSSQRYMMGFGYDFANDDYKIYDYKRHNKSGSLYSLKNNSWKIIEPPPPTRDVREVIRMVFSDNALYWICYPHPYYTSNAINACVVSFDLGTEKYREPYINLLSWANLSLVELRGRLHFIKYNMYHTSLAKRPRIYKYNIRIWVMTNNNDGSNQLWVKLVDCISLKQCLQRELRCSGSSHPSCYRPPRPCAYLENRREMLIDLGGIIMVQCDLSTGKVKKVEIRGLPIDGRHFVNPKYDLIPWISSFVSPCT
ncbi:F-box/kelch-repeat protein At3g23880-like [Chenopodium quinoa]|uniref:F-box/kelch-repeat protein At3g23880-like n=1 Tax=Chenopodium quinoa TaxID=63459 RepID=UPI000B78E2C8|nr:F-box/kelch-repeat protein At3g23880-like [Chenopodium quinoa]